ncbi:hypothetical protein CC78DRAFT_524829 [Lojkania enalia]|uniref:CAP20-like protein n=1 Tax=Lojkania enalia TaxID=147567 RepID=A0A9P4K004_9PLEO|nr:hypothetical protein CC78DRAFT_524829 [Didymosphaeria enalia]
MPHAEKDTAPTTNGDMNNTAPMTNGEEQHSKVLSHLQSYPVVHDALEHYKTNPYGAKSLSLVHATYQRLIAPLHPYLQTPYSYLSPYLSRADELGDTGLTRVDTRFPIVKEDTKKLWDRIEPYVGYPIGLLGQSKEYVMGTWQDEYRKTRGEEGVKKFVLAVVSTELKMGVDGVEFVKGFLRKGKEVGEKKVEEMKQ